MRERQAARERGRAREFEVFVGGAGGRLLHAARLLTAEDPQGTDGSAGSTGAAERLLTAALARTYADWDRLGGDDPYEHTRRELATRFAYSARRYRHPRGGVLERLPPRERLVVVLRLYEGVAEEQAAAGLGMPVERVRALCMRAVAALRSRPAGPAP